MDAGDAETVNIATVEILMATYNAGDFLSEQVESILGQSYSDWRLLVRDDGSDDETPVTLDAYAKRYPQKIRLLRPGCGEGAVNNFSALLQKSTSPYVMFSDHDDCWLPAKIEKSMEVMKKAEKQRSKDVPILVYSDLKTADENLNILGDSYFAYQGLNPHRNQLRHLLVQNVALGCTMLLNRALIEKVASIPSTAVMHDHWIALVAQAFGEMVYFDEPLLLYRQHGRNIYGSKGFGMKYFFERRRQGIAALRERYYQNVTQAKSFLGRYQTDLKAGDRCTLEAFASLDQSSWIKRRWLLLAHRIFKCGFRRNAGMFIVV